MPLTLVDDPARILVVDDDPPTRLLLRRTLERDGHVVDEAEDGEHALELFERWQPDAVLLDGCMPGMDGFSVCARLSSMARTPIVMVTSLDDEGSIARAFQAGATDYVPKPINCSLLRHRLRRTIVEHRHQAHVAYLAHYDPVTGLPNRVLLLDRLQHALARAERRHEVMALLYFDLDGFKQVNDTRGHKSGDRLLKEIGDRLASLVRSCDTIARLGGDEFVAVLTNAVAEDGLKTVARKILTIVATPVPLGNTPVSVTASIGVAFYPKDGPHLQSLVENADAAMYCAKQAGGNTYRFFCPSGGDPASQGGRGIP